MFFLSQMSSVKQQKTSVRDCGRFIVSQIPFRAQSLQGFLSDDGNYYVMSYNQLIACWLSGKGWLVNSDKYSVTTSKHQNIVRRFVGDCLEANFHDLQLTIMRGGNDE